MKIKFPEGKQREFINKVLEFTGCPSLKELINRGINVSYSSLKNYYSERRLLPEELFKILCGISNQRIESLDFEKIPKNFGQIKGGRNSRK